MKVVGFLVTFLAAWFALDRLATSPMMPVTAGIALLVAAAVLAAGEILVKAVVAAGIVSLAVVAAYLVAARVLGLDLALRAEWPLVLVGVFLFNGLAEEMVWRGFAFRHLREGRTFRRAVLWSMPLIALTHVPILLANGPLVGVLAMVSAAITCLPLAYLYERGGRTIWAPALVHATVDTWALLQPGYPMTFSIVVLVVSITVPLLAFAFGDRFFGHPADQPMTLRSSTGRPSAIRS
jgi:membrane protease YdiL (CAAX protease family)